MLEFGEDLLDRVEIGGVFGQQEQLATCGPNGVADGRAFVTAEVIHDHQIPGMERRPEDFFDIGSEPLAVDRAIQQPGRFDPVVSQRGDEGHRVPMAIGNFAEQSGATLRPAAQRRQVGFGPGLVDEDQPLRVNPRLVAAPLRPAAGDVRAILFAGENGFFYS